MIDRQRSARTKVVQLGKIIAKDASGERGCTVDSLHKLGACISFKPDVIAELPNDFDLTFDEGCSFWSCRVIWRNKAGSRIGVAWKLG
jgi:hypothetical protein